MNNIHVFIILFILHSPPYITNEIMNPQFLQLYRHFNTGTCLRDVYEKFQSFYGLLRIWQAAFRSLIESIYRRISKAGSQS